MKFDPLSMRAAFEKQKTVLGVYNEAYEAFTLALAGVKENVSMLLGDLKHLTRNAEVLLVYFFGLNGVECLRSAIKHVPREVPEELRACYVENITTCAFPEQSSLIKNSLKNLIRLFDDFKENDHDSTLRMLSLNTGTAYTGFLAPPTSTCINEECEQFQESNSLYRHHPTTTVSIFTLEGPTPVTKTCLKCKDCGTIYNYNSFGKKKVMERSFMIVLENLLKFQIWHIVTESSIIFTYC